MMGERTVARCIAEGLVGGEGSPLESANGAHPGLWRYKINVEVREKFGLAPNLC
jgi:hypothetical protein